MIDTFYREMRSALGFGRLWFTIDEDGLWLFVWHPDREHTCEHRIDARQAATARDPLAMARSVAHEMRHRYPRTVTADANNRHAPA